MGFTELTSQVGKPGTREGKRAAQSHRAEPGEGGGGFPATHSNKLADIGSVTMWHPLWASLREKWPVAAWIHVLSRNIQAPGEANPLSRPHAHSSKRSQGRAQARQGSSSAAVP